MKRIRVSVNDSPPRRSRFHRDEILNAVDPGKILVSGLTWQGDLQPVLDTYLEPLKPLEGGFIAGHVVHAEWVPPTLDLGRVWAGLGDFRDRVLASYDEKPGAVDVTEVLQQIEAVRREMGTRDPKMISDASRRLRDAARRVSDAVRGGLAGDSRRLMPRGAVGDFSKPASIATINQRNRDFYASRDVIATRDSATAHQTAIRDADHAVRTARNQREQIEAMNTAARLHWSSREPSTITADMRGQQPAPTTIAEMNQRARAFWATR